MRLILEEYGPEIDHIQGNTNIEADVLSIFPIDGNQKTTQYSNYKKEIKSEVNNIKNSPEGIFHISLKLIDQYQWKDPIQWLNIINIYI